VRSSSLAVSPLRVMAFISHTILDYSDAPNATYVKTEFFGPVLSVVSFVLKQKPCSLAMV
jgi:acyl-CoA reductase-like NAD-dependent aldehyde dehydrogenase